MIHSWTFAIDRGGTFTDLVAIAPDNQVIIHKLLSENPERYKDAVLQGIRDILGTPASEPIPSENIEVVKIGTTVATNALLEHKGEPTCLIITRGFRDLMEIGNQARPNIFDLEIIALLVIIINCHLCMDPRLIKEHYILFCS